MATESITKRYVIKDDITCDRLIEILSKPSRRKPSTSTKVEEGKKLLSALRASRSGKKSGRNGEMLWLRRP